MALIAHRNPAPQRICGTKNMFAPAQTTWCSCGAPAEFACDWPVKRPVLLPVSEAVVGDVALLDSTRPREGRWTVAEIREHGPSVTIHFVQGSKVFPLLLFQERRLMILRPAPCGELACDLHVREIGEKRHYCREHWGSWRDVA